MSSGASGKCRDLPYAAAMARRCPPHRWTLTDPQDSLLVCQDCASELNLGDASHIHVTHRSLPQHPSLAESIIVEAGALTLRVIAWGLVVIAMIVAVTLLLDGHVTAGQDHAPLLASGAPHAPRGALPRWRKTAWRHVTRQMTVISLNCSPRRSWRWSSL